MTEPVLFYVRHGETEWNKQGRLQGQRDSALTALGLAQAVQSAGIVRDLVTREGGDIAALDFVASPLGRARATMEAVRAALGLDPAAYRTDARLAELSFGRWEGVAYPELLAHESDALAAREKDKWNFTPPGGRKLRRPHGTRARLARDGRTRQRGGGPRRHGARARRLARHRRAGKGRGVRYRAGRRLPVRRRRRCPLCLSDKIGRRREAAGLDVRPPGKRKRFR